MKNLGFEETKKRHHPYRLVKVLEYTSARALRRLVTATGMVFRVEALCASIYRIQIRFRLRSC
jgi:hypothetical protein